ncbi:MAG: DNA polymerase IV [Clostridiales bacterium]|nr:DNA polymerase IV [Clostridiales bacterium]
MKKVILHVDCNKFYASVECLHRPELRGLPMAVGGSEASRHGIVLTKSQEAADYGVKTGEALWQARQKCPGLIVVPPNYPLYMRFSELARKIYCDYTDLVEPYGLDECWLDVTGSGLFGDGESIAQEIRNRVKRELGITVSIGVSYNKVFAKLGSDYKKPDAVTVIKESNFKDLLWPLPVRDMFFVGRATEKKLKSCAINTIGDIARCSEEYMKLILGKHGQTLHAYAWGLDRSPVRHMDEAAEVKSIGNSSTAPRDLKTENDVKVMIYVLAESVGRRMREQGFRCKTLSISVRDKDLQSFSRQIKLSGYTAATGELAARAMDLFNENYDFKKQKPIRSIGLTCSDFEHEARAVQLDLFGNAQKRLEAEHLDATLDELQARFGKGSVRRGVVLTDRDLSDFIPGSGFNPFKEKPGSD